MHIMAHSRLLRRSSASRRRPGKKNQKRAWHHSRPAGSRSGRRQRQHPLHALHAVPGRGPALIHVDVAHRVRRPARDVPRALRGYRVEGGDELRRAVDQLENPPHARAQPRLPRGVDVARAVA